MAEGKVFFTMDSCATFRWEIDVDCFEDKYVGDRISSPILTTVSSGKSKNEWQFHLYPESLDLGYIALYLFNLSENKTNIEYSFSLLTRDNHHVAYFSETVEFQTPNSFSGKSKFVEKSFVFDKKNKLITDNKLIVECKIITDLKPEEKEFQTLKNLCRLKEFDKFERLLTNEQFSDVTIISGAKKFYLHKCILTVCSDVFESMFKKDVKERNRSEIEIKDIRYQVLEEFFRFIYTGKVNNIREIVDELLLAAEKYHITELKTLCEETICTELTKKNAVQYLDLAITNNAEKVKEAAINKISLHLEEFTENLEFETFEKQHPGLLFKITKKHFATQKKIQSEKSEN